MKRPIPFPGSGGAGHPGDPLDALLGRLPEPVVPEDLPERTLAQVRAEAALDQLLERGLAGDAPTGLAQRVLTGLAVERRAQPELTGLSPQPRNAPSAPRGLRGASSRPGATPATHQRPGPRRLAPWILVGAAACLLVGLIFLSGPWERRGEQRTEVAQLPPVESTQPEIALLQPVVDIPDAELLQVLDLLENWETLTDPAVLALEYEADAAWWDELEAVLEGSQVAEDSDEG